MLGGMHLSSSFLPASYALLRAILKANTSTLRENSVRNNMMGFLHSNVDAFASAKRLQRPIPGQFRDHPAPCRRGADQPDSPGSPRLNCRRALAPPRGGPRSLRLVPLFAHFSRHIAKYFSSSILVICRCSTLHRTHAYSLDESNYRVQNTSCKPSE